MDLAANRAQMAVVMALLLDLNYDYYEGADPGFWDVPSWAARLGEGLVAGYDHVVHLAAGGNHVAVGVGEADGLVAGLPDGLLPM